MGMVAELANAETVDRGPAITPPELWRLDALSRLGFDLRPNTRLVLMVLDVLGDDAKFPGLRALADYLGVSRVSVRTAICELVDAGLLAVSGGKGSGPMGLVAGCKFKLPRPVQSPEQSDVLRRVLVHASGRRTGRLVWMSPDFDAGTYLASVATDCNPRPITMSEPDDLPDDEDDDLDDIDPRNAPQKVITPAPPASPPAAQPPAPPEPSPAPRSRKPKAEPKPKLTPEQMQLIATSSDALKNYICFGAEAVGHPDPTSLKPSSMNFYAPGYDTLADGQKVFHHGKWGAQHFAGYYWYAVGWHRECRAEHADIPGAFDITLPNWPKLIGHMKNLLGTMTAEALMALIRAIVPPFTWALCRKLIGPIAYAWELNESTIANSLVLNAARSIVSHTDMWIETQVEKISASDWEQLMGSYPR